MRIDEFEFRNEKGQEIEPTKAQLVVYIKSLHKDIKDLEAKLAEKEKEFNWLHEKFAKYREYRHQDKILFAVEQLMGVQKYISDNDGYIDEEYFGGEINEFIDNQIKQLKEECNETVNKN